MKEIKLFFDRQGKPITNIDFLNTLEQIKANDCDILYIHSALTFGIPNPELKRTEILEELYTVILKLNVSNILMPTYTFSFCNGKIYDPISSKSKMGALNEYFRVRDGIERSNDPLLSVAFKGKKMELINQIGVESIGKNSNFDLIRKQKNVKFLFLGTRIGDCFTYMHYLEWLYNVDYRYNRSFKGIVIENNKEIEKEYFLFVRYNGVTPNNGSYIYEQNMYDKGIAKRNLIGDNAISIVEESLAADYYKECLIMDPYFFVNINPDFKKKDKTFILDKEMVAL